jgi:phosphate/phosphite/phosphonate ABC transporter binding protein
MVFGAPIYREGDDGETERHLTQYLSRALGIRVDLRMAEPYHELPRLLRTGVVDVAQLPPLAYVRLRAGAPEVRPIVTVITSGNPTYLGHLYVKDSSPFHSLSDLRNARVGYVAPESTSGYLFPRDLLRRKGYDPDAFFSATKFFGNHPRVLEAVLNGEVDVGAAEDVTNDWLGPHQRPDGLRVIAKTERIPNDCVAARPKLDDQTIVAVLQALVALRPGAPASDQIIQSTGVNGWVAADEARYERVRDVLSREKSLK